MDIERTVQMNVLFSYYGTLLTDKQQEYMQLYYGQDLSLGEIAEIYDVTRQAVYDTVNRTEKALVSYEDKLHIVSDTRHQVEAINVLKTYTEKTYPEDTTLQELIKQLMSN